MAGEARLRRRTAAIMTVVMAVVDIFGTSQVQTRCTGHRVPTRARKETLRAVIGRQTTQAQVDSGHRTTQVHGNVVQDMIINE